MPLIPNNLFLKLCYCPFLFKFAIVLPYWDNND